MVPLSPFRCPVCGYLGLEHSPRGSDGGGSYEICPSCGFQFGVTDEDRGFSYDDWREEWIAKGMPWDSNDIEPPPANWNPKQQLAAVMKKS